jgi:hypothetical protein
MIRRILEVYRDIYALFLVLALQPWWKILHRQRFTWRELWAD